MGITLIFLQSEMKVLVISLLLVDVLHGSYVGNRPKCSTVTRDVCTDTVVKECDNPKETSVPAKECHSDYETKCHTVLESICHDESVPVCETKLDQMCQIEEKTERNTVTRSQNSSARMFLKKCVLQHLLTRVRRHLVRSVKNRLRIIARMSPRRSATPSRKLNVTPLLIKSAPRSRSKTARM